MNAICLVVDRLHAGYLGAYGNAWIETPSLDRLASQSLVFDRALIDSPQLERLYRSYWQGWHAMCPPPPESRPGLAALLRQAGVTTALVTDEPQVARHPLADEFDELVEIDPPWQPQTAGEIDQTHFARCFVEIIDWLQSVRGPFLLWCHLGGLGTTWDAPLKFRRAYCEEGDPPPPESADVPDRMLPPDHDPDELLGMAQSYAGQVTMFDTCLGALVEYIDSLPAGRESLLTLTSPRGFPLGEHRRVGPCDDAIYGELVHVPWMLRLPEGGRKGDRFALCDDQRCASVPASGPSRQSEPVPLSPDFYPTRSQALVEPADLWATLLDWWAVDAPPSPTAASVMPMVRGQSDVLRDRLCIVGDAADRAIRTPAWYLRTAAEPELFAKPDDRWEVNDVASRCREVVECLQDALVQYELTLPAGRVADLPPLGDVLLHGLE